MSMWAWVAQADDDFSPACSDRRCDDCHEDDCVCACHIDVGDVPDVADEGGDFW